MKTFKKSMAIILSILMLFSVMTVAGISASAVDEDNTTETSVTEATEASSEEELIKGLSITDLITTDKTYLTSLSLTPVGDESKSITLTAVREDTSIGGYIFYIDGEKVKDIGYGNSYTWVPTVGTHEIKVERYDLKMTVLATLTANVTVDQSYFTDTPTVPSESETEAQETSSETEAQETSSETEAQETSSETEAQETSSETEAQETSSETEAQETSSETEATEATETTKATEPPTQMEPRSAYYVVGSIELFGTSWGDTPHNPANSMELKDDGIYYLTLENVAAGSYSFKVIDTITGSITWHPDGMGNDGVVSVTEDGSSVTFAYKPGESAGVVAVNEIPTYPAPTETETVTETEPVTTEPAVIEGKATVTVSSNVDKATVTNTYDLSRDKTFTVKFNLKTAEKLVDGQGTLTYDKKSLELISFTMPNIANAVINTELANKVAFNFTDCQNLYDFTTAKTFIEATFRFKSAAKTAVDLTMDELNGNNAKGDVAYVTDGAVVSAFSMSAKASTPTPAPTAAPKLNCTKVTKKAGQSFTLSVKNQPKGTKLSFSSSKKSVAVVSSNGKVSALKKGSATISVKIKNGSKTLKTLTCKVTVSNNPTIKPAKTLTVKEGKKATIKIKGKAKAVKNVYKVKNKKIAKVTSKTTAEKVTVKGLKKGSTTLTLKVNNKSFKVKVKVK